MIKFKIGDKVRCTDLLFYREKEGLKLNQIYTVSEVIAYGFNLEGFNSLYDPMGFELVKEEPKFQVGDRVKCLYDHTDQFTKGAIYTVTRVMPGSLSMIDDRGVPNGWGEESFEILQDVDINLQTLIENVQKKVQQSIQKAFELGRQQGCKELLESINKL